MDENKRHDNPFNLFEPSVPLAFCDGTEIYNKLKEKFITHKIGYFILAPSGAGKTHFTKNQKEPHWMDGDFLWMSAKAHPNGPWWLESLEVIDQVDQKSDVITSEAKKLGFWILGASNNWLKPDAIVIPNWSTHKKYIRIRETTNYDGGATSDKLDQVKGHRNWILKWKKKGVPCFKSVEEATKFLESKIL